MQCVCGEVQCCMCFRRLHVTVGIMYICVFEVLWICMILFSVQVMLQMYVNVHVHGLLCIWNRMCRCVCLCMHVCLYVMTECMQTGYTCVHVLLNVVCLEVCEV